MSARLQHAYGLTVFVVLHAFDLNLAFGGSDSQFIFLHLGGLSDHLSSWVMHVSLSDDSGSIRSDEQLLQVVDNHLVHA